MAHCVSGKIDMLSEREIGKEIGKLRGIRRVWLINMKVKISCDDYFRSGCCQIFQERSELGDEIGV